MNGASIRLVVVFSVMIASSLMFTGCQSPGFPKLAFWKKDSPILTARHDGYIETPSSQLTPFGSKKNKSPEESGLPPTQPPLMAKGDTNGTMNSRDRYQVDEEPVSSLEAATAKLLNQNGGTTKVTADQTALTNGSSQLARQADQLIKSASEPEIQLDMNNTPNLDRAVSGGSFQPGSFRSGNSGNFDARTASSTGAQTTAEVPRVEGISIPKKISNPYSSGTGNQIAGGGDANSGFGGSNASAEQTASFNYPTTPYREFEARGQGSAYSDGSLQPSNVSANVTENSALQPSPLARIGTPLKPNHATAVNNNSLQPANSTRVATLPPGLSNSQGSYTPGSIKQVKNLDTTPRIGSESFQPAAGTTNETPAGSNNQPSGGGSFKLN